MRRRISSSWRTSTGKIKRIRILRRSPRSVAQGKWWQKRKTSRDRSVGGWVGGGEREREIDREETESAREDERESAREEESESEGGTGGGGGRGGGERERACARAIGQA